jgi:hypothetical protein
MRFPKAARLRWLLASAAGAAEVVEGSQTFGLPVRHRCRQDAAGFARPVYRTNPDRSQEPVPTLTLIAEILKPKDQQVRDKQEIVDRTKSRPQNGFAVLGRGGYRIALPLRDND